MKIIDRMKLEFFTIKTLIKNPSFRKTIKHVLYLIHQIFIGIYLKLPHGRVANTFCWIGQRTNKIEEKYFPYTKEELDTINEIGLKVLREMMKNKK
jgi:hypothetical protein